MTYNSVENRNGEIRKILKRPDDVTKNKLSNIANSSKKEKGKKRGSMHATGK